jgi:virulence-associated protein VagC
MSEDRTEWEGKTFKSGNSVALRIPKGLGVPEGTEVRLVKEARMSFRVEPVEQPKRGSSRFLLNCENLKSGPAQLLRARR